MDAEHSTNETTRQEPAVGLTRACASLAGVEIL